MPVGFTRPVTRTDHKRISYFFFMNISDEKLLYLCEKYGAEARLWRQKFCGLLPEVNRRQLYTKKGFNSIFLFAYKIAGLSEEQVRRVLNLEKKFVDKPILKSLLTNGEVSVNKLARIASIATKQNQNELADKVQILPSRALETFVLDEKSSINIAQKEYSATHSIFQDQEIEKSVHVHTATPELDEDVKQELLELEKKGIDINTFLRNALNKYHQETEQEKEEISNKMANSTNSLKQISRYIPAKIRKIITKEHGNKCSIRTCSKPSQQLHHTQRYGLIKNTTPNTVHDPHYLAPLCKEHHQIAHSLDVKFYEIHRSRNTKHLPVRSQS